MKKIIFVILIPALLICSGCSGRKPYRTAAGNIWHTVYHITYQSDKELGDSILSVMRAVELSVSPFEPTSLVSSLNRGDSVYADRLLESVMEGSRKVWQMSHGAFDPTVAPLVNLWGFGWTGDGAGVAPRRELIDSVLEAVGMGECYISSDGLVMRKHPATQFNFSAIAKGLGCDEVGAMLSRNGVDNYMVEIGGEIAVNGVNPRGEAWHVQIDLPVENDTAIVHDRMTVVEMSRGGIATSGNYRNYRDTDRGRVGHTISPVTGEPVVTETLSATVIAGDCMTADALATACMAMPADSALTMIESAGNVYAILVVAASDSTMVIRRGGDWRNWAN